ncbi:lysoplasmalogenase [Streptomyces sp. NPDC056296]|uniref:lysoplasmalogenase n=1 Tax=Streptomyces sp. NPDC056296 TaxID=3345775 RepID=UPI0035DC9A99
MPPLIAVFAGLAAVDITAVAAGWPVLEWLSKPLLAPVLALHLWFTTGRRHAAVLAGLGFAAAGDIALLLPGAGAFAVGLGFFLGAQICWTAAFVRAGAVAHLRSRRSLCVGYLAAWSAAVVVLAPALGPGMALALTLYSLALVVMAGTAHAMGRRAAWGGTVFVASDLLIGLGAAGVDFAGRSLLVMPTYTIALFLLVTAFTADAARTVQAGGRAAVPSSAAVPIVSSADRRAGRAE